MFYSLGKESLTSASNRHVDSEQDYLQEHKGDIYILNMFWLKKW